MSGPTEILFVDCAKTFAANAAVMRLFFPCLLPESLIIQQDYATASRLIWIHAAMEYLWDFLGSWMYEGWRPYIVLSQERDKGRRCRALHRSHPRELPWVGSVDRRAVQRSEARCHPEQHRGIQREPASLNDHGLLNATLPNSIAVCVLNHKISLHLLCE